MIRQVSADILSSRELSRQVKTYLLASALFWIALSLLESILLLDLRLIPGHSVSLTRDWTTFLTFCIGATGFLLASALCGTVAALPAVAGVLLANSGSPFNQRFESSGMRMRRMALNLSLPAICCMSHLFLLLFSVGSAPNYFRMYGSGEGVLAGISRQVYEMVFSELQFDQKKAWRKFFSGSQREALVIFLPASILSQNGAFPLVERVLGAPLPYMLDSDRAAEQLSQFPLEKSQVFNPSFASLSALEISAKDFVLTRLALSQPHLFVLLRFGLGEQFSKSLSWGNLVVDDAATLAKFLGRELSPNRPNLHAIALKELDLHGDGIPSLPIKLARKVSATELRQRTHDLDLLLARGIHALRQFDSLDIMMLPFPDGGNGFPFSKAYIKLGNLSAGGLSQDAFPMPGKHLTNQEVAEVLRNRFAPKSDPQKNILQLSDGGRCWTMDIPPGFLANTAREKRQKMMAEVLPRFVSSGEMVLDSSSTSVAALDLFYDTALFCRSASPIDENGSRETVLLWNRLYEPTGDTKNVKRTNSLAKTLVRMVEMDSENASPISRATKRPTKERVSSKSSTETPIPLETIDAEGRLRLYRIEKNREAATIFSPLPMAKQEDFLRLHLEAIKAFFLKNALSL